MEKKIVIQWQLIVRHRSLAMLAILALPIILCSGCSSRTPSCTSEDVKGLVLDISKGELRNQLTGRHFSTFISKMASKMASDPRVPDEKKLAMMGMMMNPNMDKFKYDDVVEFKGKLPGIDDMLSTVDKEVAALKINLIDITLGEKHPDIKKCECGGVLSFANGKTLNINYSAQFTEDGKIQVAVGGLEGL
jgi:hypothetical protein